MRLLCVLSLMFLISLPAAAHEDRQVDEFEIEFGWQHEPIYTGQMNGPELYIFAMATEDHDAEGDHEHDDGAAEDHEHEAEASDHADEHTHGEGRVAVTDAELQVEVMFGPESVTLRLQPVVGEPGHYTAAMIPTLPGDYTFRLFGTVNGEEIDELFTSADGQFDTVEPVGDVLFPAQPTTAELLARIEALEAALADLQGE